MKLFSYSYGVQMFYSKGIQSALSFLQRALKWNLSLALLLEDISVSWFMTLLSSSLPSLLFSLSFSVSVSLFFSPSRSRCYPTPTSLWPCASYHNTLWFHKDLCGDNGFFWIILGHLLVLGSEIIPLEAFTHIPLYNAWRHSHSFCGQGVALLQNYSSVFCNHCSCELNCAVVTYQPLLIKKDFLHHLFDTAEQTWVDFNSPSPGTSDNLIKSHQGGINDASP